MTAPENASLPPQTLAFVPMQKEHLDACAALAQHAPDPWSHAALQNAMLGENRHILTALCAEGAVAFACFLCVGDSADLEQVVVAPEYRNRHIARELITRGLAHIAAQGVSRCLLEVRASNAPAIALYQALGFAALATRPGMYQNPKENGILMARPLG